MIAKHLNNAKNAAGDMAVERAKGADLAGRAGDNATARKLNRQARDFSSLAVKIAVLEREAVELMVR